MKVGGIDAETNTVKNPQNHLSVVFEGHCRFVADNVYACEEGYLRAHGYIKEDSDEEKYSEFLEEYRLRGLVRKYSDYIRYPIKMPVTRNEKVEGEENKYESVTTVETLNSMVPIWKKPESEVSDEEYKAFYSERFYDFEGPAKVITQKSEGTATYTALLFIPKKVPYNYYTKEYEKGLELYSSGVMIMERCADLLPRGAVSKRTGILV